MKKQIIKSLSFLSILSLLTCSVLAAQSVTETWNHGDPQYVNSVRAFRPATGSLNVNAYDEDIVTTFLSFRIGTNAKNNINNYYIPSNQYFGVDIKAVPDDSSFDRMSVQTLTSTLPNVKLDVDSSPYSGYNIEAEAVALGNVNASTYSLSVTWNDYRVGSSSCPGGFKANCEISKKQGLEYNVQEWLSLCEVYYGPDQGYID